MEYNTEELDAGVFIGQHKQCIANEIPSKKGCESSNGLAIYEHETDQEGVWYDGYCYSCEQSFSRPQVHSSSVGEDLGVSKESGVVTERKKFSLQVKQPPLNKTEVKDFMSSHSYSSGNYRGIKDEYSKFFGHMVSKDDKGKVTARYYPETSKGKLVGYKCRNHPKDFRYGKRGKTGLSNDLSGQVKFNSGGKYLLIVGGEEDKAAAYEMLRESQLSRGQEEFSAIAVVSPTTGEPSAAKQVALNYDFCDTFENIIIGMDNDDIGLESAKKIADVLPKDKVKIATWTGKDPNKMLNLNMSKQFVRDFYSAKEFKASMSQTSHNLMPAVREELLRPRITLPSYMNELQLNMRGGIPQGRIVNLIGDTSVGKSTHVNGLVYHLIFNAPEKPAIMSLEATAGQYALDLLSIHLETNLIAMGDGDSILEYLDDPKVMKLYEDLWVSEIGEERFVILDERKGTIKNLEEEMERMSSKFGCKIFVIDVLSDLLRGSSTDSQEDHMAWQKNFVKYGNTIINVLHTRKPPTSPDGKTRDITEYDALGSSSFVQSAHINILIDRDKMSEDDVIKNTTRVRLSKCRGGVTGEAGEWFYDMKTRKVYDKKAYFGK